MVIRRFTGARTLFEVAERRAQRGVALSFWLTAPYIAAESVHDLLDEHHAHKSVTGIVLTAVALVLMPLLGRTKHKLAARLTRRPPRGGHAELFVRRAGRGGAGLVRRSPPPGRLLVVRSADRAGIVVVATWQGVRSWHGKDCGC